MRRARFGLLSLLLMFSLPGPSLAGVVSTGGNVSLIPAPASVKAGAIANDTYIYLFEERNQYVLPVAIPINAFSANTYDQNSELLDEELPINVTVDIYYLHYDAVGLNGGNSSGSVTFENPILGVIEKDGDLHDTDTLTAFDTIYPSGLSDLGYEFGDDSFTISADRRTLSVNVKTGLGVDDLRILVSSVSLTSCPVDLVIIQDTSGSMVAVGDALCLGLPSVATELQNIGVDLDFRYWGIVDTNVGCPDNTVNDALGFTVPGGACTTQPLDSCSLSNERWADASSIVAGLYPWRPGSIRAVIPVSDVTGCTCNSINGNAAINNAIVQCNANGVQAFPMVGNNPYAGSEVDMLALASGTNGSFISGLDNANQIGQILLTIANVLCAQGCIAPLASYSMPDSVCTDAPIIMDASASYGGSSYYLEICPIGVDCNTYGWSAWIPGQAGVINLRDYYDFTVTEQYNVKLAMSNACAPWDEQTQVLTIAPDAVLSLDQQSPLAVCNPVSVTAQISGGIGPYTLQWSVVRGGIETSLPNNSLVLNLDPTQGDIDGKYRLVATNVAGCSSEAFIDVMCVCDFNACQWDGMGLGIGPTHSRINALLFSEDNSASPLIAAGNFFTMNQVATGSVARLQSSGPSSSSWVAMGDVAGSVNALVKYKDEVYIGGNFTLPPAVTPTSVARWTGADWQIVAGITGTVNVLDVHDWGAGPVLYAGGDFPDLLVYDGSVWNSDGAISTNGYSIDAIASTSRYGSPALAIGGNFPDIDGLANTQYVALMQNGSFFSLDTGWINAPVHALEEFDDGNGLRLYAGGEFVERTASISLTAPGIWQGMNGGVGGGDVYAMTVAKYCGRDMLIIGGEFLFANGEDIYRVIAWDGSAWNRMGLGMTELLKMEYSVVADQPSSQWNKGGEKVLPPIRVAALAYYGKYLIAGGSFLKVDDLAVRGIAQWSCELQDVNGPWDTPIDNNWYGHTTIGAGTGLSFVKFGGSDGDSLYSDTWTYMNNTWTAASPVTVPSGRNAGGMVFDTARGIFVMHGGSDGAPINETWEFDGTDWALRSTDGPALYSAGFAYDSARGVSVWYGGNGVGGRSPSTLEWDGTDWNVTSSFSPPGYRSNLAMAYDPIAGHCVMFGGQSPGNVYQGDTWVYDGAWRQIATSGPSARRFHSMTYDPINGGIILHGGENESGTLGDTWFFRGDTWTLIDSGGVMPNRSRHAAFFDVTTSKLRLVAGFDGTEYLSAVYSFEMPLLAPSAVEDIPTPRSGPLLRSYPNPFNPSTTITYVLPEAGYTNLAVYDLQGRIVRHLIGTYQEEGPQSVTWQGNDNAGKRVASGIYFLRLETGLGDWTHKVVLAK